MSCDCNITLLQVEWWNSAHTTNWSHVSWLYIADPIDHSWMCMCVWRFHSYMPGPVDYRTRCAHTNYCHSGQNWANEISSAQSVYSPSRSKGLYSRCCTFSERCALIWAKPACCQFHGASHSGWVHRLNDFQNNITQIREILRSS